jgi:hypothetical protein
MLEGWQANHSQREPLSTGAWGLLFAKNRTNFEAGWILERRGGEVNSEMAQIQRYTGGNTEIWMSALIYLNGFLTHLWDRFSFWQQRCCKPSISPFEWNPTASQYSLCQKVLGTVTRNRTLLR